MLARTESLFALLCLAAIGTTPLTLASEALPSNIAAYLAREADPDQSRRPLGVARSEYLRAIYAVGNNAPLWIRTTQINQLISRIDDARSHGLDPQDYHLDRLRSRLAEPVRNPARAAELDILLTDALARLAYHLRFGKANPHDLDPDWNYSRALETADPARWLRDVIVEDRLAAALDWLRPQTSMYNILQQALQRYREIERGGGWAPVPAGPTLKPGAREDRVADLRARLAAEGFVTETAPGAESNFGAVLERAVLEFQQHHGLIEDGLVGERTLAALNMPVSARIDQLRVNLERIRWVFRDREPELLVVNIAAFQAAYINNGEIRWRARAVVGRPYRQTPTFKATMTHIIANPTWTVPPTIMRKDVLPAMAKDPAYLGRKQLRVLDRSGRAVDPESIDWQRTAVDGFPYILRQDPGPDNALGRIKFMFPNPHLIYLHDTPSRELFERAERTFSSGCIRVERPLELAEQLLHGDPAWQPETVFASTRERRFNLSRPVTVMLLYLTAFADLDGGVRFRRDIYRRDPGVLHALDGPFTFSPPRGYRDAEHSGQAEGSTRRHDVNGDLATMQNTFARAAEQETL